MSKAVEASLSQFWKNSVSTHLELHSFAVGRHEDVAMITRKRKHSVKLSLAFLVCQQKTYSWMGNQWESRIPPNFGAQEPRLTLVPKLRSKKLQLYREVPARWKAYVIYCHSPLKYCFPLVWDAIFCFIYLINNSFVKVTDDYNYTANWYIY